MSEIPDYLDGYEELIEGDARITFLKEAKEKCRGERLRMDQIPEDSQKFSNFQMQRLLKRNKINTNLEMVTF